MKITFHFRIENNKMRFFFLIIKLLSFLSHVRTQAEIQYFYGKNPFLSRE